MGDITRTHSANRLRARPSLGLLAFVFLSTLTSTFCHQVDSRTAVGLHLGQSYGTSAAHFANGTVVNLAKVPAGPEYTAVMQHLVGWADAPYWRNRYSRVGYWLSLWHLLRPFLGLPPTDEVSVLAELVAALKVESEAALGSPITLVSVAAPWVAAWQGDIPANSIVNDALAAASLKPWTWETTWPIYLAEANALLAVNGRWHCRPEWCGFPEKSILWPNITYLISFTNDSLYTSFQPAQCFFNSAENTRLAFIDPKYGLDRLSEAPTPALFWDALRSHLLTRVAEFTKQGGGYAYRHAALEVYPAGEAADHPDFLNVVRDVAKELRRVRVEHGATGRYEAEVVVSDDPTYAAANGAAFWLRTRMDKSYCDGVEDEYDYGEDDDETISQVELAQDDHTEL